MVNFGILEVREKKKIILHTKSSSKELDFVFDINLHKEFNNCSHLIITVPYCLTPKEVKSLICRIKTIEIEHFLILRSSQAATLAFGSSNLCFVQIDLKDRDDIFCPYNGRYLEGLSDVEAIEKAKRIIITNTLQIKGFLEIYESRDVVNLNAKELSGYLKNIIVDAERAITLKEFNPMRVNKLTVNSNSKSVASVFQSEISKKISKIDENNWKEISFFQTADFISSEKNFWKSANENSVVLGCLMFMERVDFESYFRNYDVIMSGEDNIWAYI